MSSSDKTSASGEGVLAGILAPLRLPERALRALESLADAAQHLGTIRSEIVRVREGVEPLEDLIERTRKQTEDVPAMPPVVQRISEQAEPLSEMLPALDRLEESLGKRLDSLTEMIVALEGDESHLNKTVGSLNEEICAMHGTIRALQDDVQRVTDRLPDPDRGPLEKAKDVLTGRDV